MFRNKEEQFDFYWKEIFTGLAYNPIEFNTYRFDQTMSLPGKVNKLYDMLKVLAMNNQEVMDYLKAFVETFDFKLETTIKDVLDVWLNDGVLADIVREAINDEVVEARTDYLGKKYVNLKERLDSENTDVNTRLAQTNAQLTQTTAQLAQIVTIITPQSDNDRNLINNAIAEVALSNRVKKVVLDGEFKITLPDGVNSGIMMKDNVILEFTPNSKVILNNSNLNSYRIIDCTNINNWQIINPYLVGDRDFNILVDSEWGHGMHVRGCKHWVIKNLYSEKCNGDGLNITRTGPNQTEDFYIDKVVTYNCSRNGVTIASGNKGRIDYIYGESMNGTLPKACLDIESNAPNEQWEDLSIGKVISKHCFGGVKFQPFAMASQEFETNINVTIDEIQLIGDYPSDTGTLYIHGGDTEKVKGKLKIGRVEIGKSVRGLYITGLHNNSYELHIEHVSINAIDNAEAIYIEVDNLMREVTNLGNIKIDNIEVNGDYNYLLNIVSQVSGIMRPSGLRIGNVSSGVVKPIKINGPITNLTKNELNTININDLELYNKGNNWFSNHFHGTKYINTRATVNKFVKPLPSFNMQGVPITIECMTSGIYFGVDVTGQTILPESLAYINGFKTLEKGARITFVQNEDLTINIIEKIGNWITL